MKICLLQTPWSDASHREFKGIAKRYALYPPLGLMHLAAAVDQSGHSANIFDLEIETVGFDEVCRQITDSGADIIGITATTPVYHLAQAYAAGFRQKLGLPIIIGGPHITVMGQEEFSSEFDFAVIQEGEETLVDLLNALENDGDLREVQGLLYRDGNEVITTTPRPFLKNLDELPIPARNKVDPLNYIFEVAGKGVIPVGTIELTRGCPFKCVFCSEPLNTGRGLRKRSPKSVVDEMLTVKGQHEITHFFLLDSTLTLNRRLIEGFCQEVISRKVDITWEGQTRANLIDEDLLLLMKEAGLVRLSFGVESADKEVLRLMRKEVDVESMRNAFRLCNKLGISTLCGTMIGNPGETKETAMHTAKVIRSIPEIRYAPVGIAIPYPGTELYHMAEAGMHGLKLLTKDFTKYSRYAGGVMEVNGMGPAELLRLQRRALISTHMTLPKLIGLVQHFGLLNIALIGLKMLKNELIVLFGGTEPILLNSIAESNTTLRGLGLTYRND